MKFPVEVRNMFLWNNKLIITPSIPHSLRAVLVLLLWFPSFLGLSQEFLPVSEGEIIHHRFYSLAYNEDTEQAHWVYYHLDRSFPTSQVKRRDNFRPDPLVSTISAQLSDYKASGYDRGHLVPAGDMTFSKSAMSETFYMSNMAPQLGSFNRGIWKNLETLIRSWALSGQNLIVIAGGVFQSMDSTIGPNRVVIPTGFYKIVYDTQSEAMIGFLFPHRKGEFPLEKYAVPVNTIEELTDIDFFSALPDDVEEQKESQIQLRNWDFKAKGVQRKLPSETLENKPPTTQCKGIAKSTKRRCKTRTRQANGYCHAHQVQATN